MKNFLLLLFFLGIGLSLSAQDEAVFTHYYITPILVNPAAAGFDETHQIQFNARAQWTGFPDAPTTLGVQYNGPIGKTFGLGAGVLTESAGQLNRLRFHLNYAFRFSVMEDDLKLAAGFSTEFQQQQLSNDALNDGLYQPGDDIIEGAVDGRQVFDASLGFFGRYRENTYLSFSFTNLVRARLDDIMQSDEEQESFLNYYVFLAGHEFNFEEAGFSLEPSIMFRQLREAPFQLDVNLKAGFLDDQLITGLSYRSLGAVGVLLGTRINNFNLYYTFDLSTQEFQKFTSGSHEVTVALNFKQKQKNPYNNQ